MKKNIGRRLALLLCMAMILNIMSPVVTAAEGTDVSMNETGVSEGPETGTVETETEEATTEETTEEIVPDSIESSQEEEDSDSVPENLENQTGEEETTLEDESMVEAIEAEAEAEPLAETGTICFDISKEDVSITDSEYSGWVITDEATGTGESKNVSMSEGHKVSDYNFVVKQSDSANSETDGVMKSATLNTISIGSEAGPVNDNVNLTLDGVHIGVKSTGEDVNGKAAVYVNVGTGATVSIILANNSNNILYGGNNRAGLEKGGGDDVNSRGTLVLTCESGKSGGHQCGLNGSCGKLQATGGGNLWYAGAGIGTCGHGTGGSIEEGKIQGTNALTNLHIQGGIITAKGARGKDGDKQGYSGGGAGIGMGVSRDSQDSAGTVTGLVISGGYICAEGGDYSTAGIGGAFFSGYVSIQITGGTIYANRELYQEGPEQMRAPGIGGAGGGTQSAAKSGATVEITGGDIYSYSKYGAGIGSGGGGATSQGAPAKVTISGGKVYAESIYGAAIGSGGSIGTGTGGDAEVTISSGDVTAVTNGNGAAIGSAAAKESGSGGNAAITIRGGNITTQGNGEGAGLGAGAGGTVGGIGGNATVTISGGTVVTTTIGGGKTQKAGGKGGDATVGISGDGTKVKCSSIGGGESNGGEIGSANVTVDDGNIHAQIIMQGAGSTFTMNGGVIDNADVNKAVSPEPNGGAVYIQQGTADINGGTIQNCSAENGGAIYVAGGNVNVTGGTITNNTANNEGGAIYVSGGNVTVGTEACYNQMDSVHVHPSITQNTAGKSGGALSVHDGTVNIYCGHIKENTATANPLSASIYQAGGQVDIWSGDIDTKSIVTGGALNDHRESGETNIKICFHYGDATITKEVKKTGESTSYTLPAKMEGFLKPGYHIIGWAVTADETAAYVPVGTPVTITEDTVDYYVVWGEGSTYTVTIPDRWDAKEPATIKADLQNFENSQSLELAVESANGFQMKLGDKALKYTLLIDNKELGTDKIAAAFSNSNDKDRTLTVTTADKAIYSGEYTDTLTFTVTLKGGTADNP